MLIEIIQFSETFKIKKPFKFKPHRRPKPHYRPRWHPTRQHKHGYKPPQKLHYYKHHNPQYYRYPHYANTDSFDNYRAHQPYEIEIELPKGIGKYSDRNYDRNAFYDDSYIDESDDETRVFQAGKRKVKIKVSKGAKPKLKIKISRSDNVKEIDTSNKSEVIRSVLQSNVVQSQLHAPAQSDWFHINPPQIYLKNLERT
ncbi:uncharacterized protein LOC117180232 [Belonocnema kinseyi]|uniref:uncharacterized protein LOC117180232 n=1 Tax=Belonocnema kinseyi TaxID=2817044 RepID=UPI00143DBD84|nr:uncharacterized protein LOC117180232 [Belonocnema kinseyi]